MTPRFLPKGAYRSIGWFIAAVLAGYVLSARSGESEVSASETTLAWHAGGETGEVDYEERVRIMQDWLRKRRLERENGWARERVSPQPNSAEDDDAGLPEEADYFARHGLDERGYRRLGGDLRVRIRGGQGEPTHRVERCLDRHPEKRQIAPFSTPNVTAGTQRNVSYRIKPGSYGGSSTRIRHANHQGPVHKLKTRHGLAIYEAQTRIHTTASTSSQAKRPESVMRATPSTGRLVSRSRSRYR